MSEFTRDGIQRLIDTTPLEDIAIHEHGEEAFRDGLSLCPQCGKYEMKIPTEENDNRGECRLCGCYCDSLTYYMIKDTLAFTEAVDRLELVSRSLGIKERNIYEVESDYEGEEPARHCIDDGMVYCSMPPKLKCKRCHQYWIQGEAVPICHDQTTPDEDIKEGDKAFIKEVYVDGSTLKEHDCIEVIRMECDHEYDAWLGITPQPCKKCGKLSKPTEVRC